MILNVLSSSSSGNCYVLQDNSEALIIEAGVRLSKVKEILNFDIRKVSGVITTHSHGDHSAYLGDYEKVFDSFASKHVIETRKLSKTTEIEAEKAFKVGSFTVFPFTACHDVPCLGFLIKSDKIGSVLFLTDSFACPYKFKGLNHILIECNFVESVLEENYRNGLVHHMVRERVIMSHMSLETATKYLISTDISDVYSITLLHLSFKNSDPELIYDRISKATGKPIRIAKPGLQFEITNKPY